MSTRDGIIDRYLVSLLALVTGEMPLITSEAQKTRLH